MGYTIGVRIRFARPALLVTTYDEAWTRIYDDMNAGLADPTIVWGLVNTGTMRWSDLKTPDPFDVMGKAAENGLCYGAVGATGALNSKSIACIARSDREFTDEEIAKFWGELLTIHEIVGQRRPILEIHLRILEAYSHGMTYDEISTHLDISKAALKYRLSGARQRLGASSNVEAVRIATARNLLRPPSLTGNRL